ncbi:MAG: glutamate racemase [Alistipes sp.]|nr:glutamate racemase [Alistipes sp.]
MNNNPIGVYDSGFGGLSVWRELYRALPEESIVYLGDGKNCPYGSLPAEQIRALATDSVRELLQRGCKLIVVACNTATAAAIEYLRATFADVPIVGLEPAVKPACKNTRTGVVGVIATERSLKSEKFLATLAKYGQGVNVIKSVGKGFVEAVEANEESSPQTEQVVRAVVEPIINKGADVLVLGCTHYPFLRDVIAKVIGDRNVEIIDSGEAVEKRVESLLDEYDLRAESGHKAEYEFVSFAADDYAERLRRKAFSK